jgi:hypothetical protein
MNEVKQYHGKLVACEDLGLWEGDVAPILDEVDAVDLRWKGAKIPPRILWECLAWFRLVNEKYESEAQARLGYNPKTGEWCWKAFPQYVVAGLYSKEIPADELTEEQRAMRLRATKEMADGGFMEAGTIHSHCDAGAFASGTDDQDEISQNGVHITLGKISSDRPEIHGRVVFRKIKYPIHWEDWLDSAPADIPESFHFNVKDAAIDKERLMGLCFERPKPVGVAGKSKWPSGGWGGGSTDCFGNQSDWDGWDDTGWTPSGRRGSRELNTHSALAEFVDCTVEELFYGNGLGDLLEFIGLFVQRILELEIYTPKEVLSEVLDGILRDREVATDASKPERETATEP